MGGFSTFPFEILGVELGDTPPVAAPRDTVVGHDVWIGREAMIMPGVAIGSGAIIGAGSVVTADVRPYAIVAGNPAREIRRRVDDATAEALLELAWWDWPPETIAAAATAIRCTDLAALRAFAP
jgi:virginiamycin A acetyltransferase